MTVLMATACGGGDGIDVGSGGTGISGSVVKGPAANATVVAYTVTAGQPGAQIGSATTDANGNFTMTVALSTGPVMLQASAGTFRDEAIGALMTMTSGDVMTATLPSVATGATVTAAYRSRQSHPWRRSARSR